MLQTAPPCLVVGLFLCFGMLSVLTAATSAGGARPLEPRSLGGKGFQSPTPTWALQAQQEAHRACDIGGKGAMVLFLHHGALPPPPKPKLPARTGTRAASNCGTNNRPSPF